MEKIKVSVIIPVYNTGKFLEKCLESVVNQSLKEIEIICVNDGSTDNSLEILQYFSKKDSRIVVINQKNKGATPSRNRGLGLSSGKYLYFIDSDDYLEERTMLEEIYNKSEKNNLDMVVFDNYDDFKNEKHYIKNLEVQENELIDKEEFLKVLILGKCGIAMWIKVIKKEVFIKNKIIFPEEIFTGEDLLTSLKLVFFSKKIGKINKALYNYVQHETQGTKKEKKEKKYSDFYKVYKEIEKFLKEKNVFYKYENEFNSRMFQFCKSILRRKYKNTEVYKLLKNYLIKNKKNIFASEEYKKTSIIKKIKFHLRNKIF